MVGGERISVTDADAGKCQAKAHSPKTVQNVHGFLSAVLSEFKPEMALRTTLPQKVRHEVIIPTEDDIKRIVEACIGTKYELPILLAIWLGLRESEIRGLTWDSVSGNRIHIRQAIVQIEKGEDAIKGPKSTSGNRTIRAPQHIIDIINRQPKKDDFIIHMTGRAMYGGLCRICEKIGIQHYRFHDLRHVNASVMLALGVPDKYAMQRMGHATNNMLKTVYQHTMEEKMDTVADEVDEYFSKFLPGK
jgi:integrase